MNERNCSLLSRVNETGFVLYEAFLYLDTHPCDSAALRFCRNAQKAYCEAVAEYEAECGPLSASRSDTDEGWAWGKTPWPWEMED